MQIGHVREVEQVVVDEPIASRVIELSRLERPLRVIEADRGWNERRVGSRRIPRPDPHPTMSLDDREAAHPRTRGDQPLTRALDTLAGRRKLQAVVTATQVIAFAA